MADYSSIVPESIILTRDPAASDCAPRAWEAVLLVIDENGAVSLSTRSRYGGDGTPMDEWHKRTLAFPIADSKNGACAINTDALREDLGDGGTLAQLIDRIIAGHTVGWDGNNMVGRFTEYAAEARDELDELFYQCGYVADTEVWDAEEWLIGSNSDEEVLDNIHLSVQASDAAIDSAAQELEETAISDGIILTGNMAEAIRDVIKRVDAHAAA